MSIKYGNVEDVALPLAVFLAHDNYDHNTDPNTISVTTLLKPLKQIILPGRIHPGEGLIELTSMVKSRIGTAIHDAIDKAWSHNNYIAAMKSLGIPEKVIDKIRINPDSETAKNPDIIPIYLEQRLTKKIGNWTITGKFDFINAGRVGDFKSTSVWTYKNQVNNNKYIEQGSLYRWLNPEIITQDVMDIHYIFTNWSASSIATDPTYPPRPIHTQSFNLMSLAQTEQFIHNKLTLINRYWDADEADIPQCTDEELWRSEPKYKYYKNGDINSKRSTKNFDTAQDAAFYMSTTGNVVGAIKEVPGEVTACKYCPAALICSQKDLLIENGQLVMFDYKK